MFGTEKLEEKVAETKDPIVKKELQELLIKRKKQHNMMAVFITLFFLLILFSHGAKKWMQAHHERELMQLKIDRLQWEEDRLNK